VEALDGESGFGLHQWRNCFHRPKSDTILREML
jgi:hypothetical protein